MIRDPEILQLLGRQHWVATRSQLLAAGMSDRALTVALRAGTLVRVAPQVVRLTGSPETFDSRARHLLLACGDDSYLSGVTSARLWGVRGCAEYPIEIAVEHIRRIVVPGWARLVRTSWLEPELHRRTHENGLSLASPLRTLMRLGEFFGNSTYGRTKFEKAAEDLWHRNLIEPPAAARFLADVRRSGRGGVAVFEEWLRIAVGRERASQSHAEVALVAMLRIYGLPEPQRQHPVTVAPGVTLHLDIAYPEVQLAVEPGATWWHGGNERARQDDRRDIALAELGWQTMRFDEVELGDLESCAQRVVRVYHRRQRDLRPAQPHPAA